MNIIESQLNGVLVFEPKVFLDQRGFFFESFRTNFLSNNGINFPFVQDNISKSCRNTIRGLHYQVGEFAQGKLCQVMYGKVLDVALDIRFGSPTFGQHFSTILSDENHHQVWIPAGFAHGFSVLSETAIFHYKCTNYYSKDHEKAILYNDSTLNINWMVDLPLVSEKDLDSRRFKEIEKDFLF